MSEVIHLKTSIKFQNKIQIEESNFLINKFIEACLKLDASIFEPFMNENDIFEDKDKYRFLEQIHGRFEEYRKDTLDDFEVTRISTICTGCSKGKRVEEFKVYNNDTMKPHDSFGYLIDEVDGLLIDIYQCNQYKGCEMVTIGGGLSGLPPIKISMQVLRNSRIRK